MLLTDVLNSLDLTRAFANLSQCCYHYPLVLQSQKVAAQYIGFYAARQQYHGETSLAQKSADVHGLQSIQSIAADCQAR